MIGFVFHNYNLLPRTSALENVAAPLLYQGVPKKERLARAQAALERMGLGDRLDHEPSLLGPGSSSASPSPGAMHAAGPILADEQLDGNCNDTRARKCSSCSTTSTTRAARSC